jgi:hypothetical protein
MESFWATDQQLNEVFLDRVSQHDRAHVARGVECRGGGGAAASGQRIILSVLFADGCVAPSCIQPSSTYPSKALLSLRRLHSFADVQRWCHVQRNGARTLDVPGISEHKPKLCVACVFYS